MVRVPEPAAKRLFSLWREGKTPEFDFVSNKIRTYKYTTFPLSVDFFLWKNLYEQFQRLANLYFLLISVLQLIPGLSPTGQFTTIAPLGIVLTVSALKSAYEDYFRHKDDRKVNNRNDIVLRRQSGKGHWQTEAWHQISVGDLVKVYKGNEFPADLILVCSADSHGMAYIETGNLDGETNLKPKRAHPFTQELFSEKGDDVVHCAVDIESEPPNNLLYSYSATLNMQGESVSLNANQLLLRGSTLRNVPYILGIVVYTGSDTRMMRNTNKQKHKRSRLEGQVNRQLLIILALQIGICIAATIGSAVWPSSKMPYLPSESNKALANVSSFFSFIVLFNTLIPISLYVSIEMVKFVQGALIHADLEMYYPKRDMPAVARTTSLNEELGQVSIIFSDKTGTLTQNLMKFMKFCVGGVSFGKGVTEIGRAAAKRQGKEVIDERPEAVRESAFPFWDPAVNDGAWKTHGLHKSIEDLFTILAICHTVVIETSETGEVSMQAESPDEAALVAAAVKMGFTFQGRSDTEIVIEAQGTECVWPLLAVFEFNSFRKRMSVVVEDPRTQELVCFCKGADNVMLPLLSTNVKSVSETQRTLNGYADEGLRTLVVGKRVLQNADMWREKIRGALMKLGDDRLKELDEISVEVERDFELVGCTAIEDKLQNKVPESLATLSAAGIAVWMLTGDKVETAINIGFACSLLHNDMELLKLVEGRPEETKGLMEEFNNTESVKCGLVIGGDILHTVMENEELTHLFYQCCRRCQSVICCRVSPLQKAQVVQTVRRHDPAATTLAIGDGANDVSMIQAAHVGIGISGMEGQQAANTADYAIGQFEYLTRLLLIHGRWNYKRLCLLVLYCFYKNVALQITQFWFCLYNGWTGQSLYDQWALASYNVFFTSLTILVVGVLDKDVLKPKLVVDNPLLYYDGMVGKCFNTKVFLLHVLEALYHSVVGFFVPLLALRGETLPDGCIFGLDGHGFLSYTLMLMLVNLKLAIEISSWASLTGVVWLMSVMMWPIFVAVYTPVTALHSFQMTGVSSSMTTSPLFWTTVCVGLAIALLPTFIAKYYRHHIALNPDLVVQIKVNPPAVKDSDAAELETKTDNYQRSRWSLRFADEGVDAEYAIEHIGKNFTRQVVVGTIGAVGGIIVTINSLLNYAPSLTSLMWGIMSVSFLIYTVCLLLVPNAVRHHVHLLTTFVLLVGFSAMIVGHFASAEASPRARGVHPLMLILMMLGLFNILRPLYFHAVQYFALALFLYVFISQIIYVSAWGVLETLARVQELLLIGAMGLVLQYNTERYLKEHFVIKKKFEKAARLLQVEEERSVKLLRNVFPSSIVKIVRDDGAKLSAFARTFENGSVLVSDIVKFTDFSGSHDTHVVVAMLNVMFTKFDAVATELSMEKIKTIGDAYVVTAGVPIPDPCHMEKVAQMGLAMIKCIEDMNKELRHDVKIRVGIGCGSLSAGIVGLYKLCYEVYGPGINQAELMESSGEPQKVQCTKFMADHLRKAGFPIEITIDAQGASRFFVGQRLLHVETPPVRENIKGHDHIEWRRNAEDLPEVTELFSTQSTIEFHDEWANFDGRMKKRLLFPQIIETEYRSFAEISTIQQLTMSYSLCTFIFIQLPPILTMLFPQDAFSGAFIYMYLLCPVHVAALIIVLVSKRRARAQSRAQQQRSTQDHESSMSESSVNVKAVNSQLESLVYKRKGWTQNPHKIFYVVSGVLSTAMLLSLQLSVNDPQIGTILSFLFGCINTYVWSFQFVVFWHKLASGLIIFLVVLLAYLFEAYLRKSKDMSEVLEDVFCMVVVILILVISAYNLEVMIRKVFVLQKKLILRQEDIENAVRISERMLQNVLPAQVVKTLKSAQQTNIIDSVPQSTVMFLYIDGMHDFHPTNGNAYEAFQSLNEFISVFDRLCQEHGIEKIKTNPYLVVCGCPERRSNHAHLVVQFALQCFSSLREYNERGKQASGTPGTVWRLKVGIHTGRVSAGILGSTKWVYDVFGDTVNVASRLASSADWGTIQVSETTKALTPFVQWNDRGYLELKGKGKQRVFRASMSNSHLDFTEC